MSAAEPSKPSPDPRPAVSERLARLYGPLAIVLAAISCLTLFDDRVISDGDVQRMTHFGSVWEQAASGESALAVFGCFLVAVLVGLLVGLTIAPPRRGLLPAITAGIAIVLAVLVVSRSIAGDEAPDLSEAGQVAVGLTLLVAALALTHVTGLIQISAFGASGGEQVGQDD